MNVHFYVVGRKSREWDVACAFGEGVKTLGDSYATSEAAEFSEPDSAIDVACVFALKGAAKRILSAYRTMGARTILFDKGLIRDSTGHTANENIRGYYRVALDEFMPIGRIERMMRENVSPARWVATGLRPRDRRPGHTESPIIYAGSSQKYCDFHDLGDEHEYAELITRQIRKAAGKRHPVIYRPKPSYDVAKPVDGTIFSRNHGVDSPTFVAGALAELLPKAFALVTHGSHAGIDSILAGVPTIILGDGAARPVSSTELSVMRDGTIPPYPDREKRARWLAAIGHWQYLVPEMVDGTAWRFLREEMERPAA